MNIVTSINEQYLPGLIALYNSYKRNSSNCKFYAMVEGSDDLIRYIQEIGISVIPNPDIGNYLPTSSRFPEPLPSMYYRLLVPEYFKGRSVYIDADSIILKPLDCLASIDIRGKSIAASHHSSTFGEQIGGIDNDLINKTGFISSLILFDKWPYREACSMLMESGLEFKTVVQGVMLLAVMDDWFRLPDWFQQHAGHPPNGEPHVLHFLGTNPWDELPAHVSKPQYKLDARALWQKYYSGEYKCV